jgi:acylphosphatase
MKSNKRIHMTIKGTDNSQNSRELIAAAAHELGLTGQALASETHIEVVAEGHRESVWSLVKKLTSQDFSVTFEEVVFQFADPKGDFKGFVFA